MIDYPGEGSICQSMFICKVLCTGIQGKYHLSDLKISYCHLGVVSGMFWGSFKGCQVGLNLT